MAPNGIRVDAPIYCLQEVLIQEVSVSKQESNLTETRQVAPIDTASLKNLIDGLTSTDGLRRQKPGCSWWISEAR